MPKIPLSFSAWFYLKLAHFLGSAKHFKSLTSNNLNTYVLFLDSISKLVRVSQNNRYTLYNNLIHSSRRKVLPILSAPDAKNTYNQQSMLPTNNQITKLPTHDTTYNYLVLTSFDLVSLNASVYQNLLSNKSMYSWLQNRHLINPMLNLYYLKVYNV